MNLKLNGFLKEKYGSVLIYWKKVIDFFLLFNISYKNFTNLKHPRLVTILGFIISMFHIIEFLAVLLYVIVIAVYMDFK